MDSYIKGNYKRSIFTSDKGYVIGLFKVKDTNMETMQDYVGKTITFTGYFTELNMDDTYLFYGEEVNHPKYGFQFAVSQYERVKPEDKDGIIEFLASDLFKGVGEKLATTIVDTLGENTLDMILEDPSCLSLVPKLTQKKAQNIYDTLSKYEESHKTIVYLSELGFNMKDALNIYHVYKENTIANIEYNIFQLIEDMEEISFLKIDQIGAKLNIPANDERRMKALILYIVKQLIYQSGDTYLHYDEIYQGVLAYLHMDVPEEVFISYIEDLVLEEKLIDVDEQANYSLPDIKQAEVGLVEKIHDLLSQPRTVEKKLNTYIQELEEKYGITYNEKQKEAIIKAIQNHIVIITGGPGTGKTTIIKAIVDLYAKVNHLNSDELEDQIALLAPTGRASKRMSEATLLPAMTIHRFLKWNKENNQFGINRYNRDHHRFIIIDEVSMIDIHLLYHLFEGLTRHIKIVLVGDYNQLPSVGPGQVLKDLIESKVIDTVHLDLLYRQDENSYIPTLAQEIKEDCLSDTFLETKEDYTFLNCRGTSIPENLKNLCIQIVKKGYDYKRVQVMAPMYAGINGIDNLNRELQDVFNPKSEEKRELSYGDIIFRENDKILQLVNDPDNNVFNGDIGVIQYILYANTSSSGKNEIHVDYDGIIVKYLPKDFAKIKHGFMISIHKAQGSEFELAIIPICNTYKRMLSRKLIYTGITRAKKKLILLGEPDAFIYSVHNNEEYMRKTTLANHLKNQNINV